MSKIIYIMPWAICDTEHMYIKKEEIKNAEPMDAIESVDDWFVKQVIASPDRRSKDLYVLLDAYQGYDFKNAKKEVAIVSINNSIAHLLELGYSPLTDETEQAFIRQKVLKWDKPQKKTTKKK